MRGFFGRLSAAVILVQVGVAGGATTARADISELVKGLMFICVGNGSEEKLIGDGRADVALTLKALRTGTLGASGGVAGSYTKTEWQGLIGGISAGMTSAQADQADKVRDCLAPYRAGIVQQLLKSQ
jgi:hypothetical protein